MKDDIIKADSYDFDRRIENGIKLVFFYEEFNAHCKALEQVLEEVADVYYDYARVIAIDVEQSSDVADVFAVDTLPSVIIFKDGNIMARIEGANSPTVYENAIEDII